MDKQYVTERLEKHEEYLKAKEEKYADWLKNIITVAVALLAILVSLKTGESKNVYQKVCFVITISTLGVGILTGSIALYSQIHVLDMVLKTHTEYIKKVAAGAAKGMHLEVIHTPKIYLFLEKLSLTLLGTSLLSLLAYALLTELS